jgi:DNA-directed RNA polymerase sigma subunit (sigma70/sigma32)
LNLTPGAAAINYLELGRSFGKLGSSTPLAAPANASPAQTSMMIWMLSAKDSTIRVPIHMIEAINKMVRTRRQMFNEIGREPTPEELGKKLGMPIEKVRKVLQIVKEPLSLETPIGDEEDSHLGDLIEDKNAIRRSSHDPVESARDSVW